MLKYSLIRAKLYTVRQEILTKENFNEFIDEFWQRLYLIRQTFTEQVQLLLKSKHSSTFNSSMLENCEFVKFSFRQNFLSYGIM